MAKRGDLKGKWRIVEMATKTADQPLHPGYIELDGEGGGQLAYGALRAILDTAVSANGIDFDWYGFERMEEVGGEGWIELQPDGSLLGELAFDNGDGSTLRAHPW